MCQITQNWRSCGGKNIGEAISGEVTPQEAMNNLASEMDKVMERIERSGTQVECGPKLNPEQDEAYWLSQPGSPQGQA